MDWKNLLSTQRLGKSTGTPKDSFDPRTEFYRDWDRIIFSSAFRRLQDKTQVFPLAKSDYVRTRLTHSLEVASVGRSLGMHAADVILKNDPSLSNIVIPQDVGALVSTACLAHDIGNPPFGHAGESAIQEWFALTKLLQREYLTNEELQDLLEFEGNAQGLRSLCTLQYYPQPGGMRLTCAMLGTFTKYPRASVVDAAQKRGISGKKFGFMQSEKDQFVELADVLGLIPKPGKGLAWHRHPLAFLVEAADDICYHIMDVEDGFKAGVVSYEQLEDLHRPWVATEKLKWAQESMPNTQRRAEYFRAVTVGEVMKEAVAAFATNYDGIMTGAFDDELAGQLARSTEFKAFKRLAAEKVYSSRPVVEVEACGFEVIGGLLDCFVDAIETGAAGTGIRATRARSVLGLLPGGQTAIKGISPYKRLLAATDFVAGMTDSYAVELYQRVRGISLP